jgi:malate synthase
MNMPAFNASKLNVEANTIANAQVMQVAATRWTSAQNLFDNDEMIMEMLDQRFPLQSGSHKNVKQYVVYFRHLMAFFEDGSHCGLEHPKQFVALSGHKETPEAIVLCEDGLHVELNLANQSQRKKSTQNCILEVQIEQATQRVFTSPDGTDYTV